MDASLHRPRLVFATLAVALPLIASAAPPEIGVEEYGGSPGLVLGGKPAPALFAALSTPPGSFLVGGELHLSAERNKTATLLGTKELPDSYTLEANLCLREPLTNDGNLALRFNVGEGGQAYLLVLRHNPKGNQVSLTRAAQGGTSARLLEKSHPWRVGTPVRVALAVAPGSIGVSIDDEMVGVVNDPQPLPPGKLRLTAYSARGSVDNLRVTDSQGQPLIDDRFDGVASSENWSNGKQLLRERQGPAPTFTDIGLHLYHDTDTKGGAANLADGVQWPESGDYDWRSPDRFLKAVAERGPDATVLGRINVNAPKWWLAANPDHRVVRIDPDTGKPAAGSYASFSSPKWREEASAALRAYLRHLKQHPEGRRLGGLIVGAGGSAEWVHSWGIQFHDYSPVQLAAFRAWLGERYGNSVERLRAAWKNEAVTFETAEIPLPSRRLAGDVGEFFDPAAGRQTPDYLRFHSEVVADAILHFARVIKEESPQLLTAFYYGYQFPQTSPDHDKGHSALRRLLVSEDVDALCVPSGYLTRYPGGANTVGLSLETLRLHGKLWLQDDDSRTHLSGNEEAERTRYYGRSDNAWESVQTLRRNFAFSLSKGAGLFHLDFGLGWLDDPQVMAAIADHRRIAEEALSRDRRPNSEIVVVTAPETSDYLRGGYGIGRTLYKNQYREHLSRVGAPFDVIHVDDLDAAQDYKLYIFLDTFYLSDDQRSTIDRVVKRNGKTALWLYAPGYVTSAGLSEQAMAQLTGIDLAVHQASGMNRLFLTDLEHPVTRGLMPGMLMEMLDDVGPIIYSRDADAHVLGFQNATVRYFEPEWKSRPETTPGLVAKDMDDWRSIWSAVPNLPPAILRNIAREAGVHIYSDGDDVLYANRFMLSLHTRYAGPREIRLPQPSRVVDAITREPIAEGVTSFTVDARRNETKLWWIER